MVIVGSGQLPMPFQNAKMIGVTFVLLSSTTQRVIHSKGDANPYVLAAGTKFGELKDSLECRAAEGAPRSQWFHDTWHGQLVTDLYNVFLVSAEKVGGTDPGTHWIYISQSSTRRYSVRQSAYRTAIR